MQIAMLHILWRRMMKNIIFDLLIILADGWVIFNEDSPKALKYLALLGIILLIISITMRVLSGDV